MQHFENRGQSHLEAIGSVIVNRLGGVWRRGGGMCLCPAHDDRRPSLSVRVGERALLFKCFAGCETRSVLSELQRLDVDVLCRIVARNADPPERADEDRHRKTALRLWNEAVPLQGTIAEEYLRRRRITRLPQALRFHPRTPLRHRDRLEVRPAMIAALHHGTAAGFGRFVSVQRTFLEQGAGRRARDLDDPRRLLGRPHLGAVILDEATTVLGLAEGIETALSAMILFDVPVWATLGSSRLSRIAIPRAVEHVILFADNDPAGRMGVACAIEAYAQPGRTVEARYPPANCKDWNDLLRRGGGGVGDWRRKEA